MHFRLKTANIAMRLGLLSTLSCRKFPAKPHQFENALESWQRIKMKTTSSVSRECYPGFESMQNQTWRHFWAFALCFSLSILSHIGNKHEWKRHNCRTVKNNQNRIKASTIARTPGLTLMSLWRHHEYGILSLVLNGLRTNRKIKKTST